MTNIICDSRIEYTQGDTFDLTVFTDATMESGSLLRLVIARDEKTNAIVDNTYSLNANNEFVLFFSEENKKALLIGDYIYKLVLLSVDGSIITQLSGDFVVKWGV